MPEFTGQRDLRSYLRVLWRWKYLFLIFLVIGPVAAYLLEHGKPKIYESSALVGINQETVDTSALNGASSFSTSNVVAIAQLVKTTPVAEVAASLLKPPGNPAQIVSEVTANGDPSTNFLTISAQDRNPVRAAAIANAFAKAIGLNRQNAAISELNATIAGVQHQLADLKHGDTATRSALQQQLTELQAARSTQGSEAALLQPATANYAPVGPHLRRTVELGFVISLLLAFGVVVLAESADRRMRSPDDLEGMTDLPLLASIAQSAFSEGLESNPIDEESFQMLRTALTYFNIDERLTSVLITSPGEKEGKTTVAAKLSVAAARAGSDVIVVDADLRRAGVSERFKLRSRQGLGAVLAQQLTVEDALVPLSVDDDALGKLRILPAGPPPPNPSALMSSERMHQLIGELEQQADLVVIDSPAALAVSDAVPLMKAVTGVVLVARMNQSDRPTISRLHKIVTSAHGRLLGVVATGVTSGPGYGHHYPKSYYSSGSQDGKRSRFGRRQKYGRRSTDNGVLLRSGASPLSSAPQQPPADRPAA